MSSLVHELQADCLVPDIKVSTLLRKALVIAVKLETPADFQTWIRHELEGYDDVKGLPEYRRLRGEVVAFNPYHGYQPVVFSSPEATEFYSIIPFRDPITEAESFVAHAERKGVVEFRFPPKREAELAEGMEPVPVAPKVHVQPTRFETLVGVVRNHLLDWALGLEKQGILGEGMTFSTQEKRKAAAVTMNITNNIGSMHGSQLQQGTTDSAQSMVTTTIDLEKVKTVVAGFRDAIAAVRLGEAERTEIHAQLDTIEAQLKARTPNTSIIREAGRTLRNLVENIAASGIVATWGPQLAALFS